MLGSLIEAPSFESMQECDYDHTLIDDTSAQGDDKEIGSIREDNSNMCKDVVIEMEVIQSQVNKKIT